MEQLDSFDEAPRPWRDAITEFVDKGTPILRKELISPDLDPDNLDDLLSGMATEIENNKPDAPEINDRFQKIGKAASRFRFRQKQDTFVVGHESTPSPHLRSVEGPNFGKPQPI